MIREYDLSAVEAEFGSLARYRQSPTCWISDLERAGPLMAGLKDAVVRTIGESVGGRDIVAIEYGAKEPLDCRCDNLQSALDSLGASAQPGDFRRLFPSAFFGTVQRQRPVLALQGAIHGGELSGTAVGFNLCRVIETGADIKGKSWPRLRELARQSRILFIPWANPDGSARHPVHLGRELPAELDQRLGQGIYKDGVRHSYPDCKTVFPLPRSSAIHMGSYYNDNGVNLQYDVFRYELQPETLAWMRYYREERPDAVVNFHCDNGSMIQGASAVPGEIRTLGSWIAAAVQERLACDGFRTRPVRWRDQPDPIPVVSQNSAIWHVSGALPLLCELPDGIGVPMTVEEIVDIGLVAIEEILLFAQRHGLRPGDGCPERIA